MENSMQYQIKDSRSMLALDNDQEDPSQQKNVKNWKRVLLERKERKLVRLEKNYWARRLNYFIYIILFGNCTDGLPLSLRYSLNASGGLFILLLLIFTFTLAMPLMYMEIFLGKYTRLTNSQLYRMAPIFFGFSVLIFVINTLYAPMRSTDISLYLIGALKMIIDPTYLRVCPPNSTGCYDPSVILQLVGNRKCTYHYMSFSCNGDGPFRYTAAYIYWDNFKNINGSYPLWQCIVATVITWICIILLCMLGMKVLGTFLRITFFSNLLFFTVILIMAITTVGSTKGLVNLVDFRVKSFSFSQISIVAFFITSKMGLMIPSGYMTYAAYTNTKTTMGPGTECLVLSMLNFFLNIYYLIVVYSVAGVLSHRMGIPLEATFVPYTGVYFCMIPEFLIYRESPNVFIILFHLSNWLLEVVRLALALQMHILNLYDFFPKIANYQNYVKMIVGVISALFGIMFSFEIFTKVLQPLYSELSIRVLQGFLLCVMSMVVFYCYGVSRLNDDIHFVTGRRPIKFWRILWYIYPAITMIGMFVVLIGEFDEKDEGSERLKDLPDHPLVKYMFMMAIIAPLIYMLIIFMSTFFFIVMGIRSSTTIMNLLKPQFHWGPPNKEARIARKSFAPRTSIRSQPSKKKKQRFRPRSIKQMHERDIAEKVKRGRIFLDSMFFTNVGQMESRYITDYRLHVRHRMSTT